MRGNDLNPAAFNKDIFHLTAAYTRKPDITGFAGTYHAFPRQRLAFTGAQAHDLTYQTGIRQGFYHAPVGSMVL